MAGATEEGGSVAEEMVEAARVEAARAEAGMVVGGTEAAEMVAEGIGLFLDGSLAADREKTRASQSQNESRLLGRRNTSA